MSNADLIQSLNFDGINELEVKCILTSYTGGETWTIMKQLGDIEAQPSDKFLGVDLAGLELISEQFKNFNEGDLK